MGTPMREILEEHAGGMRDGLTLRGWLPGGASTDFLVPEHLDLPMDFDVDPEGRQPAGHRDDDRARRPDLPGRHGAHPRALLRARIVRLVHAVPRRPAVGGEDPARARGGRRREPRTSRSCASTASWLGPGNTFCALAPGAVEPLAERAEVLPRRVRAPRRGGTLSVPGGRVTVAPSLPRLRREPDRLPAPMVPAPSCGSTAAPTRSRRARTCCTPACRSASTCRTSAGIPALGSVGACRQCAVKQYRDENDTRGRLVMACMTPAPTTAAHLDRRSRGQGVPRRAWSSG